MTGNKLGLPPEPSRRLREAQAQQREALQEAQRLQRLPNAKNVCPECDGTGRLIVGPLKNLTRPCTNCWGTGQKTIIPEFVNAVNQAVTTALESQRQVMNAVIQGVAPDPVKTHHLPTRHPSVVVEEPTKEAPKREGTWWEVPEEPKNYGMGVAEQIARDHMLEWDLSQQQSLNLNSGQRIINEIEIEVDPFDLNSEKPLVGDALEVEDQQTGYSHRTKITRIVEAPGGAQSNDIMHLIVSPPLVGFDVNHTKILWHKSNGRTSMPQLLRLAPSFILKEAQKTVERAFKKHMNQSLGSPIGATTLRHMQELAESILDKLRTGNQIIPAVQDVIVEEDPLEPGKINVTLRTNDPTLMNILAEKLSEKLPAGIEMKLNLEEIENEPKENQPKHSLEREQSFWKLPKV